MILTSVRLVDDAVVAEVDHATTVDVASVAALCATTAATFGLGDLRSEVAEPSWSWSSIDKGGGDEEDSEE